MRINADFKQRVVVHSANMDWTESPMQGVERRPLDRLGDEVARATSMVRYAPGSHFSAHIHAGGEEFLVIDGVFQDEHGDYPVGSYVRNPPQSSHTPGSKDGCVIFVKLWQFDLQDRNQIRINSDLLIPVPHQDYSSVSVLPLYKDEFEEVSIQYWSANTELQFEFKGGAEILVLEGGFTEAGDVLTEHSWLRLPIASTLTARVGRDGAKIWMKSGHIQRIQRQIDNLPV